LENQEELQCINAFHPNETLQVVNFQIPNAYRAKMDTRGEKTDPEDIRRKRSSIREDPFV
jgi:hypothetical protein